MAGIPKVKITFDADFDELKKGVKGAQNEVEGFSSKIGKFGKVAAAAFAAATVAAAAYAGKLLIDGVKSAIADEAAQAKLATTLQNVTGATDKQIKAVEEQITQTSLLTGLTDDELRPSLDRLLRATKDITKAQDLQAVAIDVAAGSGKSLEAVTNAMAKAAEGNTAALGKLGVGLTSAQLKTMSMEQITASLAKTFEGQASKQADTFQGKMARLTVAFDEAKETVGSYVLDAITPLITSFVDKGIPAIQNFASGLSFTLGPAFSAIFKVVRDDLLPIIKAFFNFLANELIPALGSIFGPALKGLATAFNTIKNAVAANSDELAPLLSLFKAIWNFIKDNLAPILGGAFKLALEGIGLIIGGLVTAFSKFVGFLTSTYNGVKKIIDFIKNNPITNFFDDGKSKGLKASVNFDVEDTGVTSPTFDNGFQTGTPTSVFKPSPDSPTFTGAPLEAYSPAMQAAILRREELKAETERLRAKREDAAAARAEATGGKSTAERITINMGIVGDPEGAARAVVDVLNRSAARGGGGYNALVSV
jgi:phage-related protein